MLRPLPKTNAAANRFLLALAVLLVLLVLAAMGEEMSLDLPVDGKLYYRQPPSTVVPPTPDKPPPPPPPPAEQEDVKPPTIYGSEVRSESRSIYYVIDQSGSMGLSGEFDADGNWSDRMSRARSELSRSVESLPDNFKFGMVSFDCDAYFWGGEPVVATRANKDKAIAWILELKPQGSTGTANAVGQVVLRYPSNKLVVLITDGAANCTAINWSGNVPAALHREDIRLSNKAGANAVINVFGIAVDSRVFREFCQDVAMDNNGTFSEVR